MRNHHVPLTALGPVNWGHVPAENLRSYFDPILADAQIVIESIPSPTTTTAVAGLARSKTETAVRAADMPTGTSQNKTTTDTEIAEMLRKEWKEVKTNVRENHLGISVYKLASKDGKGAWFARRSIHEGIDFDTWKAGLEKEFPETMKVRSGPGSGNIRGIGADKMVEDRLMEGGSRLSVFQLSAQFLGPTSPRDFITLLLTSDNSVQLAGRPTPLRQYIIVSKPCTHPDCPSRPGVIRGSYESVELIREVPKGNDNLAARAALSLSDLSAGERRRSIDEIGQDQPTVVEWLMVTRSDPGGSVPRFLVEKGTPPGIIGDAGKFVAWLTKNSTDQLISGDLGSQNEGAMTERSQKAFPAQEANPGIDQSPEAEDEQVPSSNGIYGIISGIYGVASSVVASGFRQLGSPAGSVGSQESLHDNEEPGGFEEEEEEGPALSSLASSVDTFASALEKRFTEEHRRSLNNSDSSGYYNSRMLEKELRKLQERRRKLDEKAAQMQDFLETKRRDSKENDNAMIAKMREKHEKEMAKQEAKYRRELAKLEEKREQEERKAEARRRKTVDKDEKLVLTVELEKARVERDVALKELEILKSQVGELQAQNTMLVAKMGRMIGVDSPDLSDSKGSATMSTRSG